MAQDPPAPRRLRFASVLAVPLLAGIIATVVLYTQRGHVAPATPASVVSSTRHDTLIRDGAVLIIEPGTDATVSIPIGQTLEVILQTGRSQNVTSTNWDILRPVGNPRCDIARFCGVPNTGAWTFVALRAGLTELVLHEGYGACPKSGVCQSGPASLKPIDVR